MIEHDTPQQLTLLPALPSSEVPVQFRLDAATRRRGLRHVAELRQLLADRQAARASVAAVPIRPSVHSTAA